MKKSLKTIVKKVAPGLLERWKKERSIRQFHYWQKAGCPAPPPHIVKQKTIAEYQKRFEYTTLVETGTFLGDMVAVQKERFSKIISIELSPSLFKKAQKRFRKDQHVNLYQGDSGKVLPDIMKNLKEPAIFWLDGHYSAGITAKGDKESPILEELDAIFTHSDHNHVLLIDDARCFVGESDYPTMGELKAYIKSKNSHYQIDVKHDIIRCVCKDERMGEF